jgi:hypothetical protein
MGTFLRERRHTAIASVLVFAAAVGTAIPVIADLTGSSFEVTDGNLVVDTEGNTDWINAPNRSIGVDAEQTSSDDSYKGGAKHDAVCPDAEMGGIPPNKDDLTRLYVASERNNGDVFVYMAWERFLDRNSTASAHMGFEFNQGSTPCGGKSKNIVRTPGDILVLYDLEGGGKPQFTLLHWVTAGAATQCKAANAVPCWGNEQVLGDDVAQGEVNRSAPITDPVGPNAPRMLNFNHMFGEAAINLTDAGVLDPDNCQGFGRASLGSRSSGNSFVSTQKDFVAPIPVDLQNCGTIVIKKETNPDEDPNATDFGFAITDGTTPTTFSLKDDGTQTFTDAKQGQYTVTEDDPGAGWDLTGLSCDSAATTDLGTRTATFDLDAGETVTCTYTNRKRGTIVVAKQTDPGGLPDSFGFTAGSPLDPGTFTLQDDGTRVYSNVVPGTYTVDEDPKDGFALTELTCVDPSSDSGADALNARRAVFEVGAGETVQCTFFNQQTHNVIVLVCHENSDTLAKSSVTYGSETKDSLSGDGLTADQQAALCNTGGANFGGKSHGSASLSVNVGSGAH